MSNINQLINCFAEDSTDISMERLIAEIKTNRPDDGEVYKLAKTLAASGHQFHWREDIETADIASTGGPSSLSTLLSPLYLRAYGFSVPKLGVPGRPAGGVDVMAQLIPYRVNFLPAEVSEIVNQSGYAHFLADENFAPLDAKLFRYRQQSGSQDIPDLAVASLLSKKIACGIRTVGLDVRVAPHGNFGQTFPEARKSAARFCKVAALADIKAICFLTDARFPYQPFIGRGEALAAIKLILDNDVSGALAEHRDQCQLMAAHLASLKGFSNMPTLENFKTAFEENLIAQGSSFGAFEKKANETLSGHRHEIKAPKSGFVSIDLEMLRSVFVEANKGDDNGSTQFPDNIGTILKVPSGEYVAQDELLASVRVSDMLMDGLSKLIGQVFSIDDAPILVPGIEVVSHG